MKQIATAEEVIAKMVKFESANDTINCTVWSLSKVMIDFAKLHVEAALKAKIQAMKKYHNEGYSLDEIDAFTRESYPLKNIN